MKSSRAVFVGWSAVAVVALLATLAAGAAGTPAGRDAKPAAPATMQPMLPPIPAPPPPLPALNTSPQSPQSAPLPAQTARPQSSQNLPPQPPQNTPSNTAPLSDPTQAQQPLLGVYSLSKGAKSAELPSLSLRGRVLNGGDAAALLSIDNQALPVMVRKGVIVPLAGTKYAGFQLEVTKIDELGVHATLTRMGQEGTSGLALVIY